MSCVGYVQLCNRFLSAHKQFISAIEILIVTRESPFRLHSAYLITQHALLILCFLLDALSVATSEKWSPALQIRTVLLSIQALLSKPNPDDPLANDVAEHWKRDEKAAISQGIIL